MSKLIALTIFFSTSPASAQVEDVNRFAHFETLARAFPEAFTEYVTPRFLIPTKKAIHYESLGRSTLTVQPQLAWTSGTATLKSVMTLWFTRPDAHRITVSRVMMDPEIPLEYGWKVLIAELLLGHPEIGGIEFALTKESSGFNASVCADRLAKGVSVEAAFASTPAHSALSAFGFALSPRTARIAEPSEDSWLDEVTVRASYAR